MFHKLIIKITYSRHGIIKFELYNKILNVEQIEVKKMSTFLNYGFAWIAVFLMFLLSIKFFVRKLAQKQWKGKLIFKNINLFLKKSHIIMGVALILVGFIHGIYSPVSVFSLNIGTLCFITSILLGASYMFRKRLNKFKPWIIVHRVLTYTMVILLICHIIDVGGISVFSVISQNKQQFEMVYGQSTSTTGNYSNTTYSWYENNDTSNTDPSKTENTENAATTYFEGDVVLKDGTYTGTAQSYRGNMTVSVVISSGIVTSIDIISTNDDYRFYNAAGRSIIAAIESDQSLNVDAVSGATFSSVGIINAVNNALSNAVLSGKLPELKALPNIRRR